MGDIISAIIIGIIGSIIAAIIYELFKLIIIPLCKKHILKAPEIAGLWIGFDIDLQGKEVQTSRLVIKQFGTRISAKCERSINNITRIFEYKGSIYTSQLVLSWYELRGQCVNIGTMILHLSADLNDLKGKSLYYHNGKGEVVTKDKIYKRSGRNIF